MFKNLFFIISLLTLFSCGKKSAQDKAPLTQDETQLSGENQPGMPFEGEAEDVIALSPEAFSTFMQKNQNCRVLDVRTQEEVDGGVIPEADHIDFMKDDFEERIGELEKNTPILVYCKVGGRSSKAVEKMKAAGFKQVYHLDGGIDAWTANGYSIQGAQ
jgi:rhodanese-related sulfurtransferase